jgi:hypothetical protein
MRGWELLWVDSRGREEEPGGEDEEGFSKASMPSGTDYLKDRVGD